MIEFFDYLDYIELNNESRYELLLLAVEKKV